MSWEQVTLVDSIGHAIGAAEKHRAHESGQLHAAFSIVIVDCMDHPEYLLLQKRHPHKYHSAGLWSNACCGHPRPREIMDHAAQRRLQEELGLVVPLRPLATTTYRLDVGGGLIEHEWNQIYIGQVDLDARIHADSSELSEWKWMKCGALITDITQNPHLYSAWFPLILEKIHHFQPT